MVFELVLQFLVSWGYMWLLQYKCLRSQWQLWKLNIASKIYFLSGQVKERMDEKNSLGKWILMNSGESFPSAILMSLYSPKSKSSLGFFICYSCESLSFNGEKLGIWFLGHIVEHSANFKYREKVPFRMVSRAVAMTWEWKRLHNSMNIWKEEDFCFPQNLVSCNLLWIGFCFLRLQQY